METIRQTVNQIVEEITVKDNRDYREMLKKNAFLVVWNNDEQIVSLTELLEGELTERLHNREMFEMESVSGNDNKAGIRQTLRNMTKHRKDQFAAGFPTLEKTVLSLVIADNNCSIEKIKMIHEMADNVLQKENGFEVEYVDYLILDLSKTDSSGTISPVRLQELEDFYQEQGMIPYICTEERFKGEQERYQKAVKTIASLIVVDVMNLTEKKGNENATWRCAACIQEDKLQNYVAGLLLNFMGEQQEHRISETDFAGRIEQFLQKNISMETANILTEIKRMPMYLETIMPDCRNRWMHRFMKKARQIETGELIRVIYGTDNPLREYANLTVLIENKEKEYQNLKEKLSDRKNIKIALDNHKGSSDLECAESLWQEMAGAFRLMVEQENLERELIALKKLQQRVKSLEFREELRKLKGKQGRLISLLQGMGYTSDIPIQTTDLLHRLFDMDGYWKMETIENSVKETMIQYLKSYTQEILDWQKEEAENVFYHFLNNIFSRSNFHGNEDFWSVRGDRLGVSLEKQEYIFLSERFFHNEEDGRKILEPRFPRADLITVSGKNIFSMEYISILDMQNMEQLAVESSDGDGQDGDN